jgi:glycosyltransferase involved in cell wall biosynthesis
LIYKFSLIIATYNRKSELKSLLDSLTNQTLKDFEVIIIDQNNRDYLTDIIDDYKDILDIKHIVSNIPGLSYNRNIGLKYATSNNLCFPDDDCYYAPDLLEIVYERLKQPNTFLTCNSKLNFDSSIIYFSNNIKNINIFNVFKNAISFTIFIKVKNLSDVKFDNQLGSGARFGSGEETDMLLNLLHNGYKGTYYPDIFVYHPDLRSTDSNKIIAYSLGFGALYKKEALERFNLFYLFYFHIDLIMRFLYILTPFSEYFFRKSKRIFFLILKYRIIGFYSYEKKQ